MVDATFETPRMRVFEQSIRCDSGFTFQTALVLVCRGEEIARFIGGSSTTRKDSLRDAATKARLLPAKAMLMVESFGCGCQVVVKPNHRKSVRARGDDEFLACCRLIDKLVRNRRRLSSTAKGVEVS